LWVGDWNGADCITIVSEEVASYSVAAFGTWSVVNCAWFSWYCTYTSRAEEFDTAILDAEVCVEQFLDVLICIFFTSDDGSFYGCVSSSAESLDGAVYLIVGARGGAFHSYYTS
jgi:hypothetical protein